MLTYFYLLLVCVLFCSLLVTLRPLGSEQIEKSLPETFFSFQKKYKCVVMKYSIMQNPIWVIWT